VAATLPREARALMDVDLLDLARMVTCPALLMLGSESPQWAADITDALAATLTTSEVTMLNGHGHEAIDTAPHFVVHELRRFFDAERWRGCFRCALNGLRRPTAAERLMSGTVGAMVEETPRDPNVATESRLLSVLKQLERREPIFHRLELGTTRADFEAQTAPDFWEVGASGQRYSREFVWATLQKRYANPGEDPWETSQFHCREVGVGTFLLTYLLRQGERVTRRATIWRQTSDGGWQILYHQGTVVHETSQPT
jgi:hypothetical protein